MNGKIKGVIFDLDGTTANTAGDLRGAMNRMLKYYSLPERSITEILAAVGHGGRAFVRDSLPENLRSDEGFIGECLARYEEYYNEGCLNETRAYPGMPQVMTKLRDAGLVLAVLSNKEQELVSRIVPALYPGVDFIAVSGETSGIPKKPDPAGALHICRKMGLECGEVAFVGDSDVDILTGKRAGMYTIGVLWGYRALDCLISSGADAVVISPDELASLLVFASAG